MDKKIKVAIIGVGSISTCHIDAYLHVPQVEIVAFCDINKETLEKKGKLYGITNLFLSCDEMFASNVEIDAVSVCTWNCAHAECTIKALNAGKNVLCEKPMAMTVAEAEAMKAAALKNEKLLMIGFVRRFGNDCSVLQDFIKNGNLGDIYYAKAQYLRRNGNPGGWFGDITKSGGGPLIDLGVHVIDLVRYLMGNPKAVSVYGATYKKLGNRKNLKKAAAYCSTNSDIEKDICTVEDLAVAMIRFDNGATLNVETSFSLNIQKDVGKIELFGDKGGARLDPELQIFSEMNNYPTDITLAYPTALDFDGLFQNEIAHFIDAQTSNVKLRAPADDGIELMKILAAIYESAKIQKEVIL